jgi:hypothetical protein
MLLAMIVAPHCGGGSLDGAEHTRALVIGKRAGSAWAVQEIFTTVPLLATRQFY